jgi:hypothetical protein
MLLEEALVIFACATNNGCTETSNQYFLLHPEVKIYAEKRGQEIRQYIGPMFVDTVGPIVFAAAGGTGVIHAHEHVNLQVGRQAATLVLSWSL